MDRKILTGKASHAKLTIPAVLGTDLAGVVGADVTAFKVGDEVYGLTGGVGRQLTSIEWHNICSKDL
jgi:NADPH:quinone reductase